MNNNEGGTMSGNGRVADGHSMLIGCLAVSLPDRRAMLKAVRGNYERTLVVQQAPWTFVRLRFVDADNHAYVGHGFAKQNRYGRTADAWNAATGLDIAEGRALHALLSEMAAARAERMFGPVYALQA